MPPHLLFKMKRLHKSQIFPHEKLNFLKKKLSKTRQCIPGSHLTLRYSQQKAYRSAIYTNIIISEICAGVTRMG
jgi:hypothetical protein